MAEVRKSEAKYTEPFAGKTGVIVMMSVDGGRSIASCTQLDYGTVHALEKMIVDCTFVEDAQTDCPWK